MGANADHQAIEALFADLGDEAPRFDSLEWRLDNLYWIVDKDAKPCRFRLNDEQRAFIARLWHRNIILKARQLGFSTLMQVLQIDQAIFRAHHTGITIADTLPNATKLFAKVKFAYERLPELLRTGAELETDAAGAYGFTHGSTIAVAVSSRGGTPQLLHVSELGKIARKRPVVAEEIVTGAFESVPLEGCIVVESTAEGPAGQFYDLTWPCIARWRAKTPETKLDWRLHFFPWFLSRDYELSPEDTALVPIEAKDSLYFRKLDAEVCQPLYGFALRPGQKAWYVKKRETLRRKMKQEYPSTPEEAFEQAVEGAVYGEEMTRLREQGRIGRVPFTRGYPVNTFWDLGKRDQTAIWFHQKVLNEHRWIRYHGEANKDLTYFWQTICQRYREEHEFEWGRHFLPHDAWTERQGAVITTMVGELEQLGMGRGACGRIVKVDRIGELSAGIELTRKALGGNHWFDQGAAGQDGAHGTGCFDGIRAMDSYQYEWLEKLGNWSTEPLHNWASHGADAWRQFAQGWTEDGALAGADFDAFKNRNLGGRPRGRR